MGWIARIVSVAIVGLLTMGCDPGTTAIRLVIDTDFADSAALRSVRLEIATEDGVIDEANGIGIDDTIEFGPRAHAFPLVVGIEPLGGDASRRVRVTVDSVEVGPPCSSLPSYSELLAFASGEVREVRVLLSETCCGVTCASAACRNADGTCVAESTEDGGVPSDGQVSMDAMVPTDATPGGDGYIGRSDGSAPPYRCDPAGTPDTIALFTFDSPSWLTDEVGSIVATLSPGAGGTVHAATGPCGALCLAFTDSTANAYVEIPDRDVWDLTVGSVDLYVRLDRQLSPSAGAAQTILSRDARGIANPGHFNLWYDPVEGRLAVRIQGAGPVTEVACSDANLDLSSWTHVGVNFGSGGLALYINGELQSDRVGVAARPFGSSCGLSGADPGIAGNDNPWAIGVGTTDSEEGSVRPAWGPIGRGAVDHLRISGARRDFSRYTAPSH